jgi:hypothetical protein
MAEIAADVEQPEPREAHMRRAAALYGVDLTKLAR